MASPSLTRLINNVASPINIRNNYQLRTQLFSRIPANFHNQLMLMIGYYIQNLFWHVIQTWKFMFQHNTVSVVYLYYFQELFSMEGSELLEFSCRYILSLLSGKLRVQTQIYFKCIISSAEKHDLRIRHLIPVQLFPKPIDDRVGYTVSSKFQRNCRCGVSNCNFEPSLACGETWEIKLPMSLHARRGSGRIHVMLLSHARDKPHCSSSCYFSLTDFSFRKDPISIIRTRYTLIRTERDNDFEV